MENMLRVVQWYGDGCDCLMKDTKMCTMTRGAADHYHVLCIAAASFYDEGIQKLVQCYDMCLNNGGNYVKSSVQYVHQKAIYMVCNIFLFFLSLLEV